MLIQDFMHRPPPSNNAGIADHGRCLLRLRGGQNSDYLQRTEPVQPAVNATDQKNSRIIIRLRYGVLVELHLVNPGSGSRQTGSQG